MSQVSAPETAGRSAVADIGEHAIDALGEPRDEEVRHWFDAVRLSTPVACNLGYAALAAATEITFDRDDETINAMAVHQPGRDPNIVVFGGIVRAYALTAVGAALAQEDANGDPSRFGECFRPRFQRIARHISANNLELGVGTARPSAVFRRDQLDSHALIQQARSHLTGMMLALIAHELAHIVLLHNLSQLPSHGGPADRAMEHQADAFARAVCESVPFQSHVTFAGFLHALLFAWIDDSDGPRTTHPGSWSRLHRFVDENTELARFGISLDTLPHFLPSHPA